MVTMNEVARSVFGAWRLARLDPNGMALFDSSREGAINSFFVAVLLLPFHVVFLVLRWGGEDVSAFHVFVVEAIFYVISWTAFLVIAIPIVRLLNRWEFYFAFVSAYNWSMVVQMALAFPVVLLTASGALSTQSAELLILVVHLLLLLYEGYVIRTSLRIGGFEAAGMVILDFILGITLNGLAIQTITGA